MAFHYHVSLDGAHKTPQGIHVFYSVIPFFLHYAQLDLIKYSFISIFESNICRDPVACPQPNKSLKSKYIFG